MMATIHVVNAMNARMTGGMTALAMVASVATSKTLFHYMLKQIGTQGNSIFIRQPSHASIICVITLYYFHLTIIQRIITYNIT
jgi:hypothetical protein